VTLLTVTVAQRVETVGLLVVVIAIVVTSASLTAGLITVTPEVGTVLALANNLVAWTRLGLAVVLAAWVIARRESE
jgi:hypothetical protein